jgi:hypothetical protein
MVIILTVIFGGITFLIINEAFKFLWPDTWNDTKDDEDYH